MKTGTHVEILVAIFGGTRWLPGVVIAPSVLSPECVNVRTDDGRTLECCHPSGVRAIVTEPEPKCGMCGGIRAHHITDIFYGPLDRNT